MNIDFMSATITVLPYLGGNAGCEPHLAGITSCREYFSGGVRSNIYLVGNAKCQPYLGGESGSNIIEYDDPIDFILLEDGQILRAENNAYLEQK